MTNSLSLNAAKTVNNGFDVLSGKMDGAETRKSEGEKPTWKPISETQTSHVLGNTAASVGSGRVEFMHRDYMGKNKTLAERVLSEMPNGAPEITKNLNVALVKGGEMLSRATGTVGFVAGKVVGAVIGRIIGAIAGIFVGQEKGAKIARVIENLTALAFSTVTRLPVLAAAQGLRLALAVATAAVAVVAVALFVSGVILATVVVAVGRLVQRVVQGLLNAGKDVVGFVKKEVLNMPEDTGPVSMELLPSEKDTDLADPSSKTSEKPEGFKIETENDQSELEETNEFWADTFKEKTE